MKFHFISGLPRAGSTLLGGLLRQNPRFKAGISSGLAELVIVLLRGMSFVDYSLAVSDEQRKATIRSVIEGYYSTFGQYELIFDTNRAWCNLAGVLAELFPEARIICCVRSPAWALDSFEQLIQRNVFVIPKVFGTDAWQNVYTRAEAMMSSTGTIGSSIEALRQAWFGPLADRLIVVRYDSLVERPAESMARLYDAMGETRYSHDFDHVEHDEPELDNRLGLPGLHRVKGPILARRRNTILPPDLFHKFDHSFWNAADENPQGVLVL